MEKIVSAHSLSEAFKMIEQGAVLISRIPLDKLFAQAQNISYGAFDFDGTLITGSQWKTISELMSEDLRAQDIAYRNWYWSQTHTANQDLQTTLEDPDWFHEMIHPENRQVIEGAWIAETIRLYREARITRTHIREMAKTLCPRPGACELIKRMRSRAIISFGIEQIIQDWLEHLNLNPTAVAASRLKFDERGWINGCHINLVVSSTKKIAAHRFRSLMNDDEKRLLVVGDSIVDVHMMGKDSLNVLIVPPNELDRKLIDFRENNLAAMWDRITLILASDSLVPLLDLLND